MRVKGYKKSMGLLFLLLITILSSCSKKPASLDTLNTVSKTGTDLQAGTDLDPQTGEDLQAGTDLKTQTDLDSQATGEDLQTQTDPQKQTVKDDKEEQTQGKKEEGEAMEKAIHVTINPEVKYQTIESFGTSGCWWSQYVGGWSNEYQKTGRPVREEIAMLLFDKEYGIGLTNYRYNLGAGSKESGNGIYWDIHRKASSFETAPFTYDWNRDANAVWFLKEAVKLGVEEVVFFCNSPLERLTINKTAQMTKGEKSNLAPENYSEFAKYVFDVTEHFVKEGIPVRYVSPINEPQWEWIEGQEGCHYEPGKIAGVYRAFLEELEARPDLKEVELSGPESGEWKGDAVAYTSAILNDSVLSSHFKTIDNHSYWSDRASKEAYKRFMDAKFPDIKLRMSEWCEMVNGSDTTMDSAFHLAQVLAEDLTILNVVSWQNWVAVAPGGYRDGLIYVNEEKKTLNPIKRLWGYGNYSKFIRPGYIRIDAKLPKEEEVLMPVAFLGKTAEKEELVVVFINEKKEKKELLLDILGQLSYTDINIYQTSKEFNLECVKTEQLELGQNIYVELAEESITTFVLSKK